MQKCWTITMRTSQVTQITYHRYWRSLKILKRTRSQNTRYSTSWIGLKPKTNCHRAWRNTCLWFLRLGTPIFAKVMTDLFNKSIANGVVPSQWKRAYIRPVPKVANPTNCSDYRPISITSVMSRMMEKMVVRELLYSSLISPPTDIWRPVCVQTSGIHHCRPHSYAANNFKLITHERIRHCHCARLQQGVRYSQTF